jgi:hypothetical protein
MWSNSRRSSGTASNTSLDRQQPYLARIVPTEINKANPPPSLVNSSCSNHKSSALSPSSSSSGYAFSSPAPPRPEFDPTSTAALTCHTPRILHRTPQLTAHRPTNPKRGRPGGPAAFIYAEDVRTVKSTRQSVSTVESTTTTTTVRAPGEHFSPFTYIETLSVRRTSPRGRWRDSNSSLNSSSVQVRHRPPSGCGAAERNSCEIVSSTRSTPCRSTRPASSSCCRCCRHRRHSCACAVANRRASCENATGALLTSHPRVFKTVLLTKLDSSTATAKQKVAFDSGKVKFSTN